MEKRIKECIPVRCAPPLQWWSRGGVYPGECQPGDVCPRECLPRRFLSIPPPRPRGRHPQTQRQTPPGPRGKHPQTQRQTPPGPRGRHPHTQRQTRSPQTRVTESQTGVKTLPSFVDSNKCSCWVFSMHASAWWRFIAFATEPLVV